MWRAVAITGKSLLARADSLFDQLHANLGRAGVSILVGVEGKSWEPHGWASVNDSGGLLLVEVGRQNEVVDEHRHHATT
jgi:hypothetical protein